MLALSVRPSGPPASWERPIISVVAHLPLPFRDHLSAMFEPIPFALAATALALVAAARGRRHLAIPGLGGCPAPGVAAQLGLKPLFDRVPTPVARVRHHLVYLGGPMFPSAHVTAAAAWATFAWLIVDQRSRIKPFIVAVPVTIGLVVISRRMHYPADVLGGFILGPTIVYCTVSAARVTTRLLESPGPFPDRRVTV